MREAGARTKTHTYLRNLNLLDVGVRDDLRVKGPRAHWQDGAALKNAKKNKANTYPKLLHSRRCRLVTAGMEVGGRWEEEAYDLLLGWAKAKAEEAPKVLRGSATHRWLKRWVSLLSKAGMDSFVNTLLNGAEDTDLWNSATPPLGVVLCAAHEAPANSRMGPR